MNPPPMELKIADIYMLLGEKDIVIYQLGEQFNRVSAENAELKTRIQELENGRLEHPGKHVNVLGGPGLHQGSFGGRGNPVPGESYEPANRVDALEPEPEPV